MDASLTMFDKMMGGVFCKADRQHKDRKPVGDVGIELYAWLGPIVDVVIGAGLAVAAGSEELPSGSGSASRSPAKIAKTAPQ